MRGRYFSPQANQGQNNHLEDQILSPWLIRSVFKVTSSVCPEQRWGRGVPGGGAAEARQRVGPSPGHQHRRPARAPHHDFLRLSWASDGAGGALSDSVTSRVSICPPLLEKFTACQPLRFTAFIFFNRRKSKTFALSSAVFGRLEKAREGFRGADPAPGRRPGLRLQPSGRQRHPCPVRRVQLSLSPRKAGTARPQLENVNVEDVLTKHALCSNSLLFEP